MPSTKEIRMKIKSVNNTRKITNKRWGDGGGLEDAQRAVTGCLRHVRMAQGSYIYSHLAASNTDYHHPFLASHNDAKNRPFIRNTLTDKGPAGALNTNILRDVLATIKKWDAEGNELFASLFGVIKGLGFGKAGWVRRESGGCAGRSAQPRPSDWCHSSPD